MAEGVDDWKLYAEHRARLTDVLLDSARTDGGKLCLLGAGRCNDVDLERLAATFAEIHLVDIDAKALDGAKARQSPAVRSHLFTHAPVDLTGLSARRLRKWKTRLPTPREVELTGISTLEWLFARLPGPFDVVASTCVLTQLAFGLRDALGDGHKMLGAIRLSMLLMHLRCLVGLTTPGGTAVLACDLASSSHYPLDQLPPGTALLDVMARIIESESFYASANPNLILQLWQHDELLQTSTTEPDLLDPWLWTGPENRTYLVYAIRAVRRAEE
jgi:hypothetical protein